MYILYASLMSPLYFILLLVAIANIYVFTYYPNLISINDTILSVIILLNN